MIAVRNRKVDLFVDRFSQQWVVRHPEANFWIIPSAKTRGTIANRSTRPKRPSSNRFPAITYTCLSFRFSQGKVPYDC